MSEQKHTPWDVDDFGEPDYLDGVKSQFMIYTGSAREPIAYAFEEDRARLIAAAPDMYQALQEARTITLQTAEATGLHRPALIARIDAALAKARGE